MVPSGRSADPPRHRPAAPTPADLAQSFFSQEMPPEMPADQATNPLGRLFAGEAGALLQKPNVWLDISQQSLVFPPHMVAPSTTLHDGANGVVPPHSPVINNSTVAGLDINPVTYTGARVETLYQPSDDWSALLALSYQTINAQGVFAEMASDAQGVPQPDLTVQHYDPDTGRW